MSSVKNFGNENGVDFVVSLNDISSGTYVSNFDVLGLENHVIGSLEFIFFGQTVEGALLLVELV